jgi:hypothetical protein
VPVDAVISLAGIFTALEAIIHIAVPDTAGGDRTAPVTGTVVKAPAAVSPDLHGTKPAVQATEGEKPVRSAEFMFH